MTRTNEDSIVLTASIIPLDEKLDEYNTDKKNRKVRMCYESENEKWRFKLSRVSLRQITQ